jgi:signal transduction histidine kinase
VEAADGSANVQPDSDGVNRSIRLVVSGSPGSEDAQGDTSFVPALASVAEYRSVAQVVDSLPSRTLFINFVRPRSQHGASRPYFPTYRLEDVVRGTVNPASFRGKIVLIIPVAAAYRDSLNTPYGRMAGGLIIANALNTVLLRDPIVPAGPFLNTLMLILLGLAALIAASALPVRYGPPALLLQALAYAAMAIILFDAFGLWVNLAIPELTALLVFTGVMAARAPSEVQTRRALALERTKEELVNLREEERRRLRRDLHDGVGPVLATAMLDINTARRVLGPDSPVEELLLDARSGIQNAITEVRRLARDLRPPALDEVGLTGALHQAASAYERTGLQVSIHAPDVLPPLPAAVEVAAYRIVQEALTNVARHARAGTCTVRYFVTDGLNLEVRDDGVGVPDEWQPGVGLGSMAERAEELGGRCVVEQAPGGGTWVRAYLPLPGMAR